MKRLLLITIVVMAFVLVGVLQGSHIREDRAEDISGGFTYPGNLSEKMPPIIFDATVLPPAVR
jgi:hypothetical protein